MPAATPAAAEAAVTVLMALRDTVGTCFAPGVLLLVTAAARGLLADDDAEPTTEVLGDVPSTLAGPVPRPAGSGGGRLPPEATPGDATLATAVSDGVLVGVASAGNGGRFAAGLAPALAPAGAPCALISAILSAGSGGGPFFAATAEAAAAATAPGENPVFGGEADAAGIAPGGGDNGLDPPEGACAETAAAPVPCRS